MSQLPVVGCKNEMIKNWRKVFSLEQLSLRHDTPITFVLSQWQRHKTPSIIYLFYRWVLCLTFLIVWSLSISGSGNKSKQFQPKWIIYLTNWGYTLCTVQAMFAALMLTAALIASRKAKSTLEVNALKMYKIYWTMNTIATDIAFGITIIYWGVLYDPGKMEADGMNLMVHGFNSVFVLIDLFVVSHPIRLLHCVYPCTLGLVYALFSVIYYLLGGTSLEGQTYIYIILDWNKPGPTLLNCLGVMVFLIILHLFTYSMSKLRQLIYSKVCLPKAQDESALSNGQTNNDTTKAGYVNETMSNTTETV